MANSQESCTGGTPPPPPDPTGRIVFLDALRGPAALLVVYDHLAGTFLDQYKAHWAVLDFVRRRISEPLGIIQDFGWLGVVLFFLVSGFIITHRALRERAGEFAVRRVFRIYPPLILAILVSVAIYTALGHPPGVSTGGIFRSFTLLNYWMVPQQVTYGGAWTLAVELQFYLLVGLLAPLLRRHFGMFVLAETLATAFVLATARSWNTQYSLFAATTAYLPYLLCGQLVYGYFWARLLRKRDFAALQLLVLAVMQYGTIRMHPQFLPAANSYLISFVYAYALFLVCALLNPPPGRLLKAFSDRSYSIYLLHGSIPVGIMTVLYGRLGMPYMASLAIGLAGLALSVELSFRCIEMPAQQFGRRLSRLVMGGAR
jgi:peptidoglycan/LPS O-acetylase OafA/YrhL